MTVPVQEGLRACHLTKASLPGMATSEWDVVNYGCCKLTYIGIRICNLWLVTGPPRTPTRDLCPSYTLTK